MSNLNDAASTTNSWSSVEDAMEACKLTDQPNEMVADDPVLEIKTSEKCEILHHLVDLSKEIREKRSDQTLLSKNNKLINLLLNLPAKQGEGRPDFSENFSHQRFFPGRTTCCLFCVDDSNRLLPFQTLSNAGHRTFCK